MIASHAPRCIALAIVLALGAMAANAQTRSGQKKVYCWMQNGIKVCGDALPPEAADAARTEISMRSGLRTGQVARALTDSERTASAIAADVARREGEAEAMRVRRDLAMVESYMAESDLRRAYGERTELLDQTLKVSQLGVSNLRLSLLGLLRQAGDLELAGEPVANKLADAIQAQHRELRHQQRFLVVQRRDRAELEAEMADAVQRYRTLKGPPAQAGGDAEPAAAATSQPAG